MVIWLGLLRLAEGVGIGIVAYRIEAWYMRRYRQSNPRQGVGWVAGLFLAFLCVGTIEHLAGIFERGPTWPLWLGFTNVLSYFTGLRHRNRRHA